MCATPFNHTFAQCTSCWRQWHFSNIDHALGWSIMRCECKSCWRQWYFRKAWFLQNGMSAQNLLAPMRYEQRVPCAWLLRHEQGSAQIVGTSVIKAAGAVRDIFQSYLRTVHELLAPVAFVAIGTLGAPSHLCYDFVWQLLIVGASGSCGNWDARRAQTLLL